MKMSRLMLNVAGVLGIASLLPGCGPKTVSAPSASASATAVGEAAPRMSPGQSELQCTAQGLPGKYSGVSSGQLMLALGDKPTLARTFDGPQTATIQENAGKFSLRLDGEVHCDLQFRCASPSIPSFGTEQQCAFNFAKLSPDHRDDILYELIKGEASVAPDGIDIRLQWRANSQRRYDRPTGRLDIKVAVGTMEQTIKLRNQKSGSR